MDGAQEDTQDTPITVENGTREEESKAECPQDCKQDVDVIFPHDQCRAKDSRHHSSILHPDADENVVKEQQQTTPKVGREGGEGSGGEWRGGEVMKMGY